MGGCGWVWVGGVGVEILGGGGVTFPNQARRKNSMRQGWCVGDETAGVLTFFIMTCFVLLFIFGFCFVPPPTHFSLVFVSVVSSIFISNTLLLYPPSGHQRNHQPLCARLKSKSNPLYFRLKGQQPMALSTSTGCKKRTIISPPPSPFGHC